MNEYTSFAITNILISIENLVSPKLTVEEYEQFQKHTHMLDLYMELENLGLEKFSWEKLIEAGKLSTYSMTILFKNEIIQEIGQERYEYWLNYWSKESMKARSKRNKP